MSLPSYFKVLESFITHLMCVDTSQNVRRFSRDTFFYARNRVTSVTMEEAISIYSTREYQLNCSLETYVIGKNKK